MNDEWYMVIAPYNVDEGHSVSIHRAVGPRGALDAAFEYGHTAEGVYGVVRLADMTCFDIREKRVLEPVGDTTTWPGVAA